MGKSSNKITRQSTISSPLPPLPSSTHLDEDGQAPPEGVVRNHLHSSCSLIEIHDQSSDNKVSKHAHDEPEKEMSKLWFQQFQQFVYSVIS